MGTENYKSMRILFLGEMMPTGSCSYRIRHTEAKILAESGGLSVTLITPHQDRHLLATEVENKDGIRVLYSPGWAPAFLRRGGFSILDMLYKLKMVLFSSYDVVHLTCGHRPAQLIPAIAARTLKKRPIVDEWWEWYGKGGRADSSKGIIGKMIGIYDCLFELWTKSLFSKVIAISSKLKDRLKSNNHVHVLHGGVEIDHLYVTDKNKARQKLGLPEKLFLIGLVSVGRSEHSDIIPFMEAFRCLVETESNLGLFVTGEEKYIHDEFLSLSIGEEVIYKGWLELAEYSLYLSACDIFILPFDDIPRNAGRWPHKIGDFLYFKRPIISNPTGDFVELFKNKNIGYLCRNNSNSYQKLIKQLLIDRNNLDSMCSDSRKLAEQLSSHKRVDSFLKIYQEITTPLPK